MAWISDSWTGTPVAGVTPQDAFSRFPKNAARVLLRWSGFFASKGTPDCYLAASVLTEALVLVRWTAACAASAEHDEWQRYRTLMLRELAQTIRACRAALKELQQDAEWELGQSRPRDMEYVEVVRQKKLQALVKQKKQLTAHSRTQEFARKLRYRLETASGALALDEVDPWGDLADAITFVDQVYDLALDCFADRCTKAFCWADACRIACRVRTGKIEARRAAVEMAQAAGVYTADAPAEDLYRSAFSPSKRWGVGTNDAEPTAGAGIRPGPLRTAAQSLLPTAPMVFACAVVRLHCTPARPRPRGSVSHPCGTVGPACDPGRGGSPEAGSGFGAGT